MRLDLVKWERLAELEAEGKMASSSVRRDQAREMVSIQPGAEMLPHIIGAARRNITPSTPEEA